MNKKQIYILAAVLIFLAAGIFVRQMQKPAELAVEEYVPLDLKFETGQAHALSIFKGSSEAVKLVKSDNGWSVGNLWNARAEQAKLEQLFSEIQAAEGELRASDKNLLADFGLTEDQALRIEIRDAAGQSLSAFYIGTRKAGFRDLFVRREGSDQIFITQADLLSRIGLYGDPAVTLPLPDFWAALDLGFFDAAKVKSFEIKRIKGRKETVAAVKEGENWRFIRQGAPAPAAEKITQFLDSFRTIRAQKVADPKARDFGFAKPVWRMTLGLESGDVTLTAGPVNEEKIYPLEISGQPVVFELAEYYFQMLDAEEGRFAPDPPPAAAPKA